MYHGNTIASAGMAQPVDDDAFWTIVTSDELRVRGEFDAIVDAGRHTQTPRPPAPPQPHDRPYRRPLQGGERSRPPHLTGARKCIHDPVVAAAPHLNSGVPTGSRPNARPR
jgi:hypothetical protein